MLEQLDPLAIWTQAERDPGAERGNLDWRFVNQPDAAGAQALQDRLERGGHDQRHVVHHTGRARGTATKLDQFQSAGADAQERNLLLTEGQTIGHLQAKRVSIERDRPLEVGNINADMVQPESERHHQLARSDVAAFLADRGWRGVSNIEPITHGEWSRAFSFAVQDQSQEYVVRFSALNDDFLKDQLAARYASPKLPIPRLLDVGQIDPQNYYAISERVRGAYLDDLNVDGLRAVLPSVFDAIDGMREADISATRGFGVWDPTGHAPNASWPDALLAIGTDTTGSRIAGWRRALEESPTGAQAFDAALDRLCHFAQDLPNARHLIHSDLLNFNVLVVRDRIAAVLDWGSAMYGDWLWDVAWFVFWQPWYPAWAAIDFGSQARRHFATIGVDLEAFDLRLRCCAIAIGLDNQAYCAFRGEVRWPQLETVAQRTLKLAEQP